MVVVVVVVVVVVATSLSRRAVVGSANEPSRNTERKSHITLRPILR